MKHYVDCAFDGSNIQGVTLIKHPTNNLTVCYDHSETFVWEISIIKGDSKYRTLYNWN